MKLSEVIESTWYELDGWYDPIDELINNSNLSEIDKGYIQGCMESYNDRGYTNEQMYYELISDAKNIED